ncbi:MAG: DNA methyltransferase [Patescibacteria group bacterium]
MEKLIWHTDRRKVKDLIGYQKNPRVLLDNRAELLTESFNKFNLVEIPVIDTDNTIIAGHQRVAILMRLGRGEEEIDVRVPNRPLTKEELSEYNLRSNVHVGEWDWNALKGYEIEDLLTVGFNDIDLEKFWDNELAVESDSFDVTKALEEIEKNPIAKPGQIYKCGNHTVICGDSTDIEVVKKLVGDKKVYYINSDPPYNIKLDYSKGIGNKSNYGGKEKDNRPEDTYREFLKQTIENALAVSQPDVHVFYWCDENYVWLLQELYKELKIENKRLCIWIKNNQNVTARIAFNKMTEFCTYGVRGKPSLNATLRNLNEIQNKEIGTGNRSADDIFDQLNIWLVDRLPANEYHHPTMKPPTLYEKAIRRCTKPGDYVLDLFGGSGSQLIAAEQLKRQALLVEQDPIFVDLILLRYEQFTGVKPIRIN